MARRLGTLQAHLVAEYTHCAPRKCTTSPSGCATHACTDLYTVQSTIARRGVRAGRKRVVVVPKGALRRALRVSAMRSFARDSGGLWAPQAFSQLDWHGPRVSKAACKR